MPVAYYVILTSHELINACQIKVWLSAQEGIMFAGNQECAEAAGGTHGRVAAYTDRESSGHFL